MEHYDELIGLRLLAMRNACEMSQSDLADHMRSAGYKWAQATVWSVESGSRSLRFKEAFTLSCLFDISLDTLTGISVIEDDPENDPPPYLVWRKIKRIADMQKSLADDLSQITPHNAFTEGADN